MAVVGFSPHTYNAGVFATMRVITLDPTSWSIKEVIARRTRQTDYIAVTLSLSHGSLTLGLLCSPSYLRVHPNTGACVHDRETVLRSCGGILKIPISLRVVEQSLAVS